MEVKHFKIGADKEENRNERLVKVAAVQNKIVLPTTASVQEQKQAIMNKIEKIIEVAALEKTNVLCLQEVWTAPFFMCTRERYPWL